MVSQLAKGKSLNATAAAILRGKLRTLRYEIERDEKIHTRDLETVREQGRNLLALKAQEYDILMALGQWALVPE